MGNPVNKLGMKTIPDTTSVAGATSINLNGGFVSQLAVANDSRRSILLTNKGISYPVYIGTESTVVAGASGANFTLLRTYERLEISNYSGPLYGIHAGASGGYEQIGVLDIG